MLPQESSGSEEESAAATAGAKDKEKSKRTRHRSPSPSPAPSPHSSDSEKRGGSSRRKHKKVGVVCGGCGLITMEMCLFSRRQRKSAIIQ